MPGMVRWGPAATALIAAGGAGVEQWPVAPRKAGWSVARFSVAVQTGGRRDVGVFGAGMGEVVQQGTAWLDPADRRAMAIYLLDERAADGAKGSDSE